MASTWLPTGIPAGLDTLKRAGREIGLAYSSVVFLANPLLGAGLLGATFQQPNVALCGLIGVLFTLAMLQLLGLKAAVFRRIVLYNGLLTGLFIGYLFRLDPLVVALLGFMTALCLTLAAVIDSLLRNQGLPVLSIPFTLGAITISLARPHLSNLTDATPYFLPGSWSALQGIPVPESVVEFFRSMGCIFCLPDPVFGGVMFVLLALGSPFIAAFFLAGFGVGYGWEELTRLSSAGLHLTHYFNYSLTLAAVSLVFLAPSRKSIVIGFVATMISSLVAMGSMTYWEVFRIPIVPFAFNVTVLLVLRAARWLLPGQMVGEYVGSPEATVDRARLYRLRQRQGEIGLYCPFEGQWFVQQGFDGPWTHKGNWKHALDFVRKGPDQKTYKNRGIELEDYHCFDQPVLAPMEGHVTSLCSTLADNPIGSVDNQNNWGNHVVLRSTAGFHVVLAHLKKASIRVKVGDYVLPGAELGRCGNSGYSQEPHLHLQVQWLAAIGGFTAPFHLVNYKCRQELKFRGLPLAGQLIEPFQLNRALERALSFRIGEKLHFSCAPVGAASESRRVDLEVCLDELSGALYLREGDSRLYFGRIGAQHYFYDLASGRRSPLGDLMAAAPRIPLIYGDPVEFGDALPLALEISVLGGWMARLRELLGVRKMEVLPRYRMDPGNLEIRGIWSSTRIKLDPSLGILEFEARGSRYVRQI